MSSDLLTAHGLFEGQIFILPPYGACTVRGAHPLNMPGVEQATMIELEVPQAYGKPIIVKVPAQKTADRRDPISRKQMRAHLKRLYKEQKKQLLVAAARGSTPQHTNKAKVAEILADGDFPSIAQLLREIENRNEGKGRPYDEEYQKLLAVLASEVAVVACIDYTAAIGCIETILKEKGTPEEWSIILFDSKEENELMPNQFEELLGKIAELGASVAELREKQTFAEASREKPAGESVSPDRISRIEAQLAAQQEALETFDSSIGVTSTQIRKLAETFENIREQAATSSKDQPNEELAVRLTKVEEMIASQQKVERTLDKKIEDLSRVVVTRLGELESIIDELRSAISGLSEHPEKQLSSDVPPSDGENNGFAAPERSNTVESSAEDRAPPPPGWKWDREGFLVQE